MNLTNAPHNSHPPAIISLLEGRHIVINLFEIHNDIGGPLHPSLVDISILTSLGRLQVRSQSFYLILDLQQVVRFDP